MSLVFNIITGLIIVMNFAACNGSKKTGNTKIAFDSIGHGYYVSFDDKRMLVINDDKTFGKLRDDVYKDLDQVPAFPEVDFTKYTVIAVFMGAQRTGGFNIRVNKVTNVNDNLVIDVTEYVPGINCMVTDAITKPYDMVKIAKTDLEYEFKATKETKDCQ